MAVNKPLFNSKLILILGLKRHKLFPMAIPSQNIPQRSHETKTAPPKKCQLEARLKRAKVRNKIRRFVSIYLS